MPDKEEVAAAMVEQTKRQAQELLDQEAIRGRIPDEGLRAALVYVAEHGRPPVPGEESPVVSDPHPAIRLDPPTEVRLPRGDRTEAEGLEGGK